MGRERCGRRSGGAESETWGERTEPRGRQKSAEKPTVRLACEQRFVLVSGVSLSHFSFFYRCQNKNRGASWGLGATRSECLFLSFIAISHNPYYHA